MGSIYDPLPLVQEELSVAVLEEGISVGIEYLVQRCGLSPTVASEALGRFIDACDPGEVRAVYHVTRPEAGSCLMYSLRDTLPTDEVMVYGVEPVCPPALSPSPSPSPAPAAGSADADMAESSDSDPSSGPAEREYEPPSLKRKMSALATCGNTAAAAHGASWQYPALKRRAMRRQVQVPQVQAF
eukprot:TRINITY_DN1864_c2_g1_i1.p1 TRINITY_DN1864_c2_g1~~TRINITY_DN1864_c2_g1_i1.p1  ORF type:complete len:203 (+),score=52.28 TRINITY_DN1864_c2_g1_i1:57-611(+)